MRSFDGDLEAYRDFLLARDKPAEKATPKARPRRPSKDEMTALRSEVRKFLDQNCPLDEVRKLSESPEGFSRHLWDRMAELGWVGLTYPEVHGGVGLGWVDLVVLLEETGRSRRLCARW